MPEPENGAHVSWRELNLALQPLQDGIERIEERLDSRIAFWRNAWVLVAVSILGAAAYALTALIFGG